VGGGGGHASFGGGHGGGFGGGHVGSGGGHVGISHVVGGHFSGGIHSGPGPSRGYPRNLSSRAGVSRGPFLHDRFRGPHFGGSRFRGPRFRNYGFANNCYGYRCWGYGYPWWGSYDPWWWDSDSSYDQDYEQDLANANDMNQQSLEEQRMLRQEEADGDQDIYVRSAPTPSAGTSAEPQGASIMPATVLVFRDRHTREIQNYAIVGQTLWSFAAQHTEKIPLADLDLTATVKANDDRGLSFRLPSASEAQ
ncbi:MAG TPA: hypothetical protein VFB30_02330, partial [Spirochaetia bacterium]|nr:hypothetical protein [Spirochaetia bacterium]